MTSYLTTVLVNELTAIDSVFLSKWNNALIVYPSDVDGREKTLSARFEGPDEEFQAINYPEWAITALPFVFDIRRFNEDRKVISVSGVSGASGILGYDHGNITGPDQFYLLNYVVNGYSQDARIFREMQEFAARLFPMHAYITVNSYDHYVNLVSSQSGFDAEEREYFLQLTYEVWVVLEMTNITSVPLVYNKVVVGYTTGQGRTDKGSVSEEIQDIIF